MQWLLCALIGLCSGFLGGLLGVGGGTVIVPALLILLPRFGMQDADLPKVAIATSMAVILPTAISSARAHARRNAVDWSALRRLAPGMIAGALTGTAVAAVIGGKLLLAGFIVFALFAIWRLMRVSEIRAQVPAALPGRRELTCKGAGIGLLSSLVGIGGGLLSVPLLAGHIPLKRAIGTAAALGIPLALASICGYALSGKVASCGTACLGYIYLPAAFATSLASISAAPLGAYLASRLPVRTLKCAFAGLLGLVISDLAVKIFV